MCAAARTLGLKTLKFPSSWQLCLCWVVIHNTQLCVCASWWPSRCLTMQHISQTDALNNTVDCVDSKATKPLPTTEKHSNAVQPSQSTF